MMKKSGRRMRRPQDRDKSGQAAAFMRRDGTVTGEADNGDSVGQMAAESVKRLSVSLPIPFCHCPTLPHSIGHCRVQYVGEDNFS